MISPRLYSRGIFAILAFGLLIAIPADAKTGRACSSNSEKKCEVYTVSPATPTDESVLKIYEEGGKLLKTLKPYGTGKGAIQVRRGDVDGDGQDDLVTAPSRGQKSMIKVWSLNGVLKYEFQALEDAKFRGDVDLALSDLNGDNRKEIVVAVQALGGPKSTIYNYNPVTEKFDLFSSGFVYDKSFRGGVALGVGDIDGDNKDDLIYAPFSGANPIIVHGYDGTTRKTKATFYPFVEGFDGGQRVRVGNVLGDAKAEIVVTPAKDANPEVKIYGWDAENETMSLISSFMAYGDRVYSDKITSGVQITLGDILGDTHWEIITTPFVASGAPLRVWQSATDNMFRTVAFHSVHASLSRGLNVLTRNVAPDRDTSYHSEHEEIMVAPRGGAGPLLFVLRYNPNVAGKLEIIRQDFPFHKNFRGEVKFEAR